MDMQAERAKVVAAAVSWLGTPYHHMGRIKGAGVDCATLLAMVYSEAGVIAEPELEYYPPDWHLHRGEERYTKELEKLAVEKAGPPLPGDIVVWQFGRTFSHGCIVVDWPNVIHSYLKIGVVRENVEQALWLKFIGENTKGRGKLRPMKVYTLKEWAK